ncbi:MAG: lamin tail domain-containing protein [Chitinophagaceae bacterium]|nr:lamin tail domain-containing protein [Chitinophagaceae bacterium]
MNKIIIPLFFMSLCAYAGKAQVASRNTIIIDELMADPSPPVGLPNNEWIELRNTSSIAFNLLGWRIGDATGQSGTMPSYNLLPDSFVIVCTGSAVAALSAFGPTISVTGFPTLDNTGDVIFYEVRKTTLYMQ